MKKLLLIIGYVVGSLILLYFLLNIAWSFQTKKNLNIYILDKTVTSYERQEHKSFVWILNNSRYVRPDDKSYSVNEDYYGFYPIDTKDEVFDYKSVRINEIDAFASVYDAAYYTDCYGVYSFEWYKGKAKQIRSQKVFGGLTQNDYLFLKEMKENGRLIIGEYNMFSTPTNALLRSKTEDIYGVEWTGWSGKYYFSFDPNQSDGPPEWMPNLYENQNKIPWPTNESGIVLLSNDGLIEVLVNSQHLNNSLPKIVASDESVHKYGIASQIGFEHWFEFVTVDSASLIQANFKIDANDEGTKIFEKIGLKTEFPAIIKSSEKDYIYYFAGDFCDNPTKMITSKIIGGRWLNNFLYKYTSPNQSAFFKDFYTPLINSILNDYYQYNENLKVSK